ncbi:hypothetical protein GCM10023189_08560 [Nibrella saemangeumensis]|uniref:Secretion system C-terminal sorting domain-containing protein n=1 Tax=Nibrella saemangeumensis TaxID=1084526 RepID=A0ABP8MGQ3_9BACT
MANLYLALGKVVPGLLLLAASFVAYTNIAGWYSPTATQTATNKIPVDFRRWYQLNTNTNSLEAFFDGRTDSGLEIRGTRILENYEAYYPLQDGEEITLTAVKFFSNNVSGEGSSDPKKPLTLSIIDAQWQRIPVASFTGSAYGWVGSNPEQPNTIDLKTPISGARYLVLNLWDTYPTEIELYGTYKAPANQPTPAPVKPVKLGDMFGVNVYEWNFQNGDTPWQLNEAKVQVVRNFTGIRHYMDWDRIETIEGRYAFSPTQSGGWHYDAIYERCKAEGVTVLACLKTIPQWLMNTYPPDQRDADNVPVRYGKDFADPRSYIEQAKVGFQYIARYGSNPNVNPSLLTLGNNNEVKVGMGVVRYIECDNERDKWWEGRRAYQTAREYAANLSAFYDGHQNTMGPGVGVKNADPSVQVVIAGICTSKDYVRGMIDWCKEHRGYRPDGSVNVCWDVVNYHYYIFNEQAKRGSAPEVSRAAADARGYVQLAHEQLKGMPVWITEAGYDVHQSSPLKAIPIGGKPALVSHADWILRTALLYARSGIDKLFFYQLYDDNQSGGQYATSGLADEATLRRRPAADYLYQVDRQFGEYRYQQTIWNTPLVDRYEHSGQSMYMLVVPEEKGHTEPYLLNLGNAGRARIYRPKAGSDALEEQEVRTQQGKLKITVTETPVFVVPVPEDKADLTLKSLQVFPNPVTHALSLVLNNASREPVKVHIYDSSLGRLHRQASFPKTSPVLSGTLDMSTLPAGVYLLEITQGSEKIVQKIVKQP